MMLGIWSRMRRISAASSVSRPSRKASRSASALTSAFSASASASLEGSFLDCPHQYAHLLALGVAGGAQFLGLLDGTAVLCVQLQHLIHQGELLFLKFLLDVLLHGVGIFPDKFNVQHG